MFDCMETLEKACETGTTPRLPRRRSRSAVAPPWKLLAGPAALLLLGLVKKLT